MTTVLDKSSERGWVEISDPARLPAKPRLSVVMTAYNHGRYLAKAIESVLEQAASFQMELLINEDCSSDNTREIALEYQRRHPELIRVLAGTTNAGGQESWARLMREARGEFIAHLDGDDYWLPGKLERQVAYLGEQPDCAAVYCNAVVVDETGSFIGLFNDAKDVTLSLAAILRRGNFLNTSSMMFRSEFLRDLLQGGGPSLDYMAHLRLACHGNLAQLAQPSVVYRVGSLGSMLATSNDRVRSLYWQAILDVPRALVTDEEFARSVTDFLRRVTLRAVRTRRWSLLREWAPRVFDASPYGITRTLLMTLESIARAVLKETSSSLRNAASGHRLKVLYRY